MYGDESPMRADKLSRVESDERVGLMQAFVQEDDRLRDLYEQRERLEKETAVAHERRADMLRRLGDLLGISGSENKQSDAPLDALRQRLI